MLGVEVETQVFNKMSLEDNILIWLIKAGFPIDHIN